jgi:hypothetical protein
MRRSPTRKASGCIRSFAPLREYPRTEALLPRQEVPMGGRAGSGQTAVLLRCSSRGCRELVGSCPLAGVRNGWADTYSSDRPDLGISESHRSRTNSFCQWNTHGHNTSHVFDLCSVLPASDGNRGPRVGINANHSESSSNSHQPQMYASRVRRK